MQKMKRLLRNKVIQNMEWNIGGVAINKLLIVLVGIWMARYLGPADYGLISYAAAYITFFYSLCTLGINSIIVKEFIYDSEREGTTLGTTLVLQEIASILSISVIFIIVFIVDNGEKTTFAVVFLCSLGLLFQQLDTIKYWFQAKLKSKYIAIASTSAYIISSVYKIILLITKKNVEWFALATSVDYLCIAAILFFSYKKNHGPRLSFSYEKAKELLKSSYHYILSGLMVSVYGATDRLMLKQMLGERIVGYYSTAVSICNVWVFILSALIDSLKPVIIDMYNRDKKMFIRKNVQLYSIIFYCCCIVSLFMTVFAQIGISFLYGESFLPAVAPLRVITWYVAFSYLGVARNIWVVCENKQKYLKYLYIGAAAMNVCLNAVFIPYMGATGAALASLFTQISTICIFPVFIKEMRINVKMMLDAVLLHIR